MSVVLAPNESVTATLARRMIALEAAAKAAQEALRFGEAQRLWRERDSVRDERSLRLRQDLGWRSKVTWQRAPRAQL